MVATGRVPPVCVRAQAPCKSSRADRPGTQGWLRPGGEHICSRLCPTCLDRPDGSQKCHRPDGGAKHRAMDISGLFRHGLWDCSGKSG